MVQAPKKPITQSITLTDFLAMPETKPASEYLDGKIQQKPMPQGEHSSLQVELAPAINAALKKQKIAAAFTELRCTFDGSSIVPDISVYVWDRIPRKENGRVENTFLIHPDWIIEILSPGQAQGKVIKKILRCLKQGTPMGWLISPEEETVYVYRVAAEGKAEQAIAVYDLIDNSAETVLPVPKFAEQFSLAIGEMFDWLSL